MSDDDTVVLPYDRIVRDEECENAILVDFGDGDEGWIPRSQIIEHEESHNTITIPFWLAYREGLI